MATYVIYADASDGRVISSNATYTTARSGGTIAVANTGVNDMDVGQVLNGGTYTCYEGLLQFDTSSVSGTVQQVRLELYGNTDWDGVGGWTVNARLHDWGATLDTGDWVAGASLSGKTLLATLATNSFTTAGYNTFTSDAAFKSNINQSGSTRLILSSSRHEAGTTPSAIVTGGDANDERLFFQTTDTTGTSKDPKLTVITGVSLTPATETDTAVGMYRVRPLTPATETDISPGLTTTRVSSLQRVRSGLVSNSDWPDTVTSSFGIYPGWISTGTPALSGTDDAKTVASSSSTETTGMKRTVDLRHSGFESTTDLQLNTDWAITVTVHAGGADNSYSGVVIAETDTSNYYALRVSKTGGGTSSLVEVASGTPTTQASATADVSSGTGRVKLYRKDGRFGAVVAGQHFYYDDASPPTPRYLGIFGAPASSGTSSYQYDDIDVCNGNDVEVAGLESGEAVRIYDASGTLVASAVESSGVATLDLSDQCFPFTGFVKVFTDNTYATLIDSNARFPRESTTEFHGGDRLWARFGTDATTSRLKVVTNEGSSAYATIQYNSRSGIVHNGEMFGLVQGYRGKVYAYRLNLTTGETLDYVYVGDCADQHDSLDMTADGDGHLHIIYGGTYTNDYRTENSTYHKRSSRPWDVTAFDARTDMGRRLALLTTDSNGDVHMVGGDFSSGQLGDTKHRVWSGGSWGSETTVIQHASQTGGSIGWENYPCDLAPSHDKSRLHFIGFSYGNASSGSWINAWHLYYDVAAGAWKKLDGTSITLPATQDAGTGAISAIDTVQSGNAYVPLATVDSSGDVWMVVPSGASSVAQRTYYLYKGTLGGSWSSSLKSFENIRTKGCLAFTGNESGLVFIAPASKTAALETPWDLRRWTSEDGISTTGSSTWTEKVMYDGGTLDEGAHYWPRMAVVDGEDFFKVIWHSRYSLYGNGITSGTALSAMDGVSTVYIADIAAFLSLISSAETDAAVALTWGRGYSITPATETDAGVDLSIQQAQHVDLTAATETGAAQALGVVKATTLTPGSETDAGQALVVVKQATLTPGAEADAAVTLDYAGPAYFDLAPAVESDAGVALVIVKSAFVATSSETDAALALALHRLVTLASAAETDAPVALRVPQLVPALETDAAVALGAQGFIVMDMQMPAGTVVGAYLRHQWIGSEVPVRGTGSYPGPLIAQGVVDDSGRVLLRVDPGSYIGWTADYPLRRRFFVVTE